MLEAKLKKYDEESRDNEELNKSLLAWETFERRANDGNYPEETDRMELVKEIQVKLKDYHEALLLQSQIAALDRPSNRTLNAFTNWFIGGRAHPTNNYRVMTGVTQYMLEDKDGKPWEDLAALRTPPDKDILSSFLRKHWFLPTKSKP